MVPVCLYIWNFLHFTLRYLCISSYINLKQFSDLIERRLTLFSLQ